MIRKSTQVAYLKSLILYRSLRLYRTLFRILLDNRFRNFSQLRLNTGVDDFATGVDNHAAQNTGIDCIFDCDFIEVKLALNRRFKFNEQYIR